MNAIDLKRSKVSEDTVRNLIRCEEHRRAFEASWAEARDRCLKDLDEAE